MRAELKSLFSMELSGSLEAYKPQDPKHFGIRVMAFIGSPEDERSDSFDLLVCTATWLADHPDDPRISRWDFESNELLFGNRFVFMKHWDYQALRDAIVGVVALHEADDWGTLANRIGRHIPWEFDYKYDAFIDQAPEARPTFPPQGADSPEPSDPASR